MNRLFKNILAAVISFSVCFITVGYAAITGQLSLEVSMESVAPEGLFITNLKVSTDPYRLDVATASYAPYSTTVDCSLSKSSGSRAGSVTYEIEVYNNTKYEYAYRGLYYQSYLDNYNNNYVATSNADNKIGVVTSFPNGKIIGPGDKLTFYVTYTIGKSSQTFSSSRTYKTLLNYQFGINVETEEAAREAINDKFANILNTTTTYNQLIDVLDNKFDGRQEWTSNYVGNVGDADTDDAVAVNTLFAGQLQMIINGETRPASVIIKHENIDGNTKTGDDYEAINQNNGGVFRGYGCEMTLYLTIDSLEANTNAEVYICVFTCDRDDNGNIVGDWYRIGDSYVGLAPVVGYNGEAGEAGSFVTDNWVSTQKTYSPCEKFSYTVPANQSIKTIVQLVDQDAINVMQELLTEAKTMLDDLSYAGTGIDIIEDAYKRASNYYTVDANGNPVVKQNLTRAQLCPIIADLDHSLTEAKKVIDEILGQG